jgi:UDP:flavonoid glycosyltransferase YjiC (YdhE family)
MRSVREQVEMAVCHAGGMVDVMLQAGRPVFLLPMQMEQTMTSRRVDELGCGLFHIAQQGPKELEKGLKRVFGTPAYAERALAYQQRNANFTQAFAMERMIGSCEALLANAAR